MPTSSTLVKGLLVAGAGSAAFLEARRRFPKFRPVIAALDTADRLLPNEAGTAVKKKVLKSVYDQVSSHYSDGTAGSAFLNYGYAPLEPPHRTIDLEPDQERNRNSLQHYHRIAGAVDLAGKDVLEVGCGRGGGASFVFDRLKPATMVGVDLSDRAIADCNATFARPGLTYEAGDAEKLRFDEGSFDAVVNVESSHCYPNPDRFFNEVHRVLRPGGHLLFADLRAGQADLDTLRDQITGSGLRIVEEEDVTPNVVKSLELDSPARRIEIAEAAPKALQAQVLNFAAVEGTEVFEGLKNRDVLYTRFVAVKD
jgi:SAM-dependent methyltransferase